MAYGLRTASIEGPPHTTATKVAQSTPPDVLPLWVAGNMRLFPSPGAGGGRALGERVEQASTVRVRGGRSSARSSWTGVQKALRLGRSRRKGAGMNPGRDTGLQVGLPRASPSRGDGRLSSCPVIFPPYSSGFPDQPTSSPGRRGPTGRERGRPLRGRIFFFLGRTSRGGDSIPRHGARFNHLQSEQNRSGPRVSPRGARRDGPGLPTSRHLRS